MFDWLLAFLCVISPFFIAMVLNIVIPGLRELQKFLHWVFLPGPKMRKPRRRRRAALEA